jgi:uncharacterized membrane protein
MTDVSASVARGRLGWLMVALALLALAIALYLGLTKLAGANPACGVLHGCDTVAQSEYAQILGIPTGLFGAAAAAVTLAGALLWWLRADRRGLLASYVVGLLSLPVLIGLTYLEIFVIEAICIWCVSYAIVVVAGWAAAGWVLWRGGREES